MSTEQNELLGNKGKSSSIMVSSQVSEGSEASGYTEEDPLLQESDLQPYDNSIKVLFWRINPSIVGVGLTYFLLTLTSIAGASTETLKFSRACETNKKDGICSPEDNQILIADYQQASSVTLQIVLIAGLSIAGKISDKYGRKKALLGIMSLNFAGALIFFIAITSSKTFMFKTYLVADILTGLLGGVMGLIGVVNSYVSDITTVETRQLALSLLLAFLYCGQIIGPLFGGFLLQLGKAKGLSPETNDMTMLYIQLVLYAVALVYIIFFLPESLKTINIKSRVTTTNSDSSSLKSVTQYISFLAVKSGVMGLIEEAKLLYLPEEYVPSHLKSHTKVIRFQVMVLVLCQIIFVMEVAITGPLLLQYGIYKFHWESSDISMMLLMLSFAALFTLSITIPFLAQFLLPKVFKMKFEKDRIDNIEYTILISGILSGALVYFTIGFCNHTWQTLVAYWVGSLIFGVASAITGAITKYYPAAKTSQLLMSMSMIGTALSVTAPPIFMNIYKFGIRNGFAGLPFVVSAFFYTFLALVMIFTKVYSMRLPK